MSDPSFARLEDEIAEKPVPVPTNKGYTAAEAAEQLKKWGKNEIPEEKVPLWMIFAVQFTGPMPMMIQLAAFISLVLKSYIDFWIIFALLMTNATLGFVEEVNAQAAIGALKDGLTRKLPVKRDGQFVMMDVTEIVPGDCVFIRGGNVIPADGYWVEGDELAVDQAALTGESLPVQVPREDSDDEPLSGKRLWSGSILKTGECEYWVESTGLNTMMGEAAKSIQESGGRHVGVFEGKIIMAGRVLILITLVAVGALLYYQVIMRGTPIVEVGEMSLSLIIASVPIALPMVLKVTLSVGAKEMAKEGGIVTHLTALEEIASMKCLCSDKTGTLTTASMTVYHETAACFNGFTGKEALTYAAVASNAANKDDAIDRAVFKAYSLMTLSDEKRVDEAAAMLKKEYETTKYYGFNPMVKRTVADVVRVKDKVKMRVAKGIVSKVTKTDPDDGGEQWTIADEKTILPQIKEADATFGKSGYKTIAVVCAQAGGPMKFVGLLPIMDPPRADTMETIKKIKGAYIDVKMITGDHLNIAKELARQIELGTNIFSNASLWPATSARDDNIMSADGFAQVMPKDKHEVVAVLQTKFELVVGMTGDGVNDAPALAKAQIGIAVEGATDAAQAAADIVLTRPGLSPIFTAIMESRRIFKRLKSYVIYRICVTVQVVTFLCIISFAFNDAFEALYIILLALFHDLTIVTIAYDHQTPSPRPTTPTVKMLIFVAYTLGLTLSASSVILYTDGHRFLSEKFVNDFRYKESAMFLQISNSSAILIFTARTIGFSFMSMPCLELFFSAVVSQVFVNTFLFCSTFGGAYPDGLIVSEMSSIDIGYVWAYDLCWLTILDLVKMTILYWQGFVEADNEAERALKAAESIGTGKLVKGGFLGSIFSEFGVPEVKVDSAISGPRGSSARRPSLAGPMAGIPVIVKK